MKNPRTFILTTMITIAVTVIGMWAMKGSRAAGDEKAVDQHAPEETQTEPTANVACVPVQKKSLKQRVVGYGVITAEPSAITVVTVAFESRVRRFWVRVGEPVAQGAPLCEVEASADALAQLAEARRARKAANDDLGRVQQQIDQKLATNQDLATAKQALLATELKLSDLEARGLGSPKTLTAMDSGIVSRIAAQRGQIAPAGTSLIEIVAIDALEAKLGVETAIAARLTIGQRVEITAVRSEERIEPLHATVRTISRVVNHDSRLSDVSVTLPPGSALMMDEYVAGQITLDQKDVLAIPRGALVADDHGYHVFKLDADKALEEPVTIGLIDDDWVELADSALHEGDRVITTGNSVLKDKMAVKVGDDQ